MFRKLLTIEEAKSTIQRHFKPKPIGTEHIPLLQATGRILAEDVVAPLGIPPFDRSTVDGYAVRAEDTFGAEEIRPIQLRLAGTVNIGEIPQVKVTKGKVAEIVTGAPTPRGADAVVMMEHTERTDSMIRIFTPVGKDENIMKASSDIKKGQLLLRTCQSLGSREIGMIAAIGKPRIKVYKIPRVAVVSAGPEIVEPGKKLTPGKIYDINAYTLSSAVTEAGGNPLCLGVVQDNPKQLQKVLKHALAQTDMVVTSGGVSVGPKDVMPSVVNTLGKPGIIVSGISIRPGKPTTIASVNGKPVFSLPGHPASALLVSYLLVRPLIQQLAGREPQLPPQMKAYTRTRLFPAKGRRTYVLVTLKCDGTGRQTAEPVLASQSGAITTPAKADGYIEILENTQFIERGEQCVVYKFS
jgi:molybdenum cofactor synthesis domain-containing protein